jgi:hypothetical protein
MIIRIFMFFLCVVFLSVSHASAEIGSGTLGTISDIEDFKTVSKAVTDTQVLSNELADENIGRPLKKINDAIVKAASRLQIANKEFESDFSQKSYDKLLDTVSEEYDKILESFEEINKDFVPSLIDIVGNATLKGEKITKTAIKRNKEEIEYKQKLLKGKARSLEELKSKFANGKATETDKNKAKKIGNDIKNIYRLNKKQTNSLNMWTKMQKVFIKQSKKTTDAITGLSAIEREYNQAYLEFASTREFIEQIKIIKDWEKFSTEDIESTFDSLVNVVGSLADTTTNVLDNLFVGVLDEEPESSKEKYIAPEESKEIFDEELNNILSELK